MRTAIQTPCVLRIKREKRLRSFCFIVITTLIAFVSPSGLDHSAQAFNGIVVSDLPNGGDVTVPGQYPIRIPRNIEVLFSGMSTPQSITLANKSKEKTVLHIYAQHEKNKRTIEIKPGTSAVYNLKWNKAVRLRVIEGSVEALSLEPLKIQR